MTAYGDPMTKTQSPVPDIVPIEMLGETCDRCSARASFRVQLRSGPLFFCEHHRRKYGPALAQVVAIPKNL